MKRQEKQEKQDLLRYARKLRKREDKHQWEGRKSKKSKIYSISVVKGCDDALISLASHSSPLQRTRRHCFSTANESFTPCFLMSIHPVWRNRHFHLLFHRHSLRTMTSTFPLLSSLIDPAPGLEIYQVTLCLVIKRDLEQYENWAVGDGRG